MNLHFTEALLVAEWCLGPFDTENDLRNEGKLRAPFRDQRLEEANVFQRAARANTLAGAATILGEAVDASEEVLDELAGRVRECARRIVAARPPFVDRGVGMSQVLHAEAAARKVKKNVVEESKRLTKPYRQGPVELDPKTKYGRKR